MWDIATWDTSMQDAVVQGAGGSHAGCVTQPCTVQLTALQATALQQGCWRRTALRVDDTAVLSVCKGQTLGLAVLGLPSLRVTLRTGSYIYTAAF